jgi:LuxR family transcriptional regulator of spore coat protein
MRKILTHRESEIFAALVDGMSTQEIAHMLGISDKTVRNHISNVILKLDVKSRFQALLELIRCKEIEL